MQPGYALRAPGEDKIADFLCGGLVNEVGDFCGLAVSLSLNHGHCNDPWKNEPTLFRLPSTVNPNVVHRFAGDGRVIPGS
jgi:hypothetical protein